MIIYTIQSNLKFLIFKGQQAGSSEVWTRDRMGTSLVFLALDYGWSY